MEKSVQCTTLKKNAVTRALTYCKIGVGVLLPTERHWTIADIACELKIAFIWITGLDSNPNSAERHLRLCMCALKTRVWMCMSFCVTRSPWTCAALISQEISIQLRCRLSSKHHRLQNTVASLSHLIEGALISLYTVTKCMHVTLQPKAHTQRATVKTWLLITLLLSQRTAWSVGYWGSVHD